MDRAALDVALNQRIACGGWCPAGRLAEDGIIPTHYPVQELVGGGPAERTRENVRDSDATVIFCWGKPRGGTAETIRCCVEATRPHLVLDAEQMEVADAAAAAVAFVRQHAIEILNVAGPRESEWPNGYAYTARVLIDVVAELTR